VKKQNREVKKLNHQQTGQEKAKAQILRRKKEVKRIPQEAMNQEREVKKAETMGMKEKEIMEIMEMKEEEMEEKASFFLTGIEWMEGN
jgi:aspartyl aminopeptidase